MVKGGARTMTSVGSRVTGRTGTYMMTTGNGTTATASQVEIYPLSNHGLREYDHVTGRKSLHPGEK